MNINNAFFEACEAGDLVNVSFLISKLDNIDIKNEWKRTGLAISVRGEYFELSKLLFDSGANINATNNNGTTIFMYAKTPVFNSKKTNLLAWLLQNGANINALDKWGLSVLDYVKKENNKWMLSWMRKRGAKFSNEL